MMTNTFRYLTILLPMWLVAVACSSSCGRVPPPEPPVEVRKVASESASAEKKQTPADAGSQPVATSVVSKPGGKGGWPTFRGSYQRTGRADVAGPRAANLKWVFRTGGRIFADVAVSKSGDTVYVASHDGKLYAVDNEGNKKWFYDTGGKIWTSPSIAPDGTVYVGSDSDTLSAVSPEGRLRWGYSTARPVVKGDKPQDGRYDVDTSPAVLADGTVVFGCHTELFALRPSTGGVRWIFEAGTGKAKIFSSPALGPDGTIYFGTQGNFFFAVSQSAKVLWSIKTGSDNDSTAAVADDGTVYFASDDGILRAVAPGGNLKWETEVGGPVRAPVAIGPDGTVFASTYGAVPFMGAYEPGTGKEKWRFEIEPGVGDFYGIQSGATIDSEGYIYFGGRDHNVYCLSPSGELVWSYRTDDQVDASPALGPDGTLYIGSDDKRLYAFSR